MFPPQSLVVFLISHIHSSLFSNWKRNVSSEFFNTQAPSISIEKLVLLCHARCVLSCLSCDGHSLLLSSYLSRIGRIENPSCSTCRHLSQDTFHLILHCSYRLFALLALWQFSVSLQPLVQALGNFLASGASWSSAINPSLEMGRVTTTTAKLKLLMHYYVTKRISKFTHS